MDPPPRPTRPSGPGDTMEGNTTTELTGIIAELDTRIARIAVRPAFTGSPLSRLRARRRALADAVACSALRRG